MKGGGSPKPVSVKELTRLFKNGRKQSCDYYSSYGSMLFSVECSTYLQFSTAYTYKESVPYHSSLFFFSVHDKMQVKTLLDTELP